MPFMNEHLLLNLIVLEELNVDHLNNNWLTYSIHLSMSADE